MSIRTLWLTCVLLLLTSITNKWKPPSPSPLVCSLLFILSSVHSGAVLAASVSIQYRRKARHKSKMCLRDLLPQKSLTEPATSNHRRATWRWNTLYKCKQGLKGGIYGTKLGPCLMPFWNTCRMDLLDYASTWDQIMNICYSCAHTFSFCTHFVCVPKLLYVVLKSCRPQ